MPDPKNARGEPPTRTTKETVSRLAAKAREQRGRANRERTGRKIESDSRKRP